VPHLEHRVKVSLLLGAWLGMVEPSSLEKVSPI